MDNETLVHIVADCARRQKEGSATTTPAWSTDVLERALLTMAGDYLEAATELQATVNPPAAPVTPVTPAADPAGAVITTPPTADPSTDTAS